MMCRCSEMSRELCESKFAQSCICVHVLVLAMLDMLLYSINIYSFVRKINKVR